MEIMTVNELIIELKKYPPDIPVVAVWEGQGIVFNAKDITEDKVRNELVIDVDTWGK